MGNPPIEPHFELMWRIECALMAIMTVPLEWAGLHWWVAVTGYLAVGALMFFSGVEWASGGVLKGYAGTMSAWTVFRVPDRWQRLAFALYIVFMMWWRMPHAVHFNYIVAIPFLLWLPQHYFTGGRLGPVDRFVIWLGDWTGVTRWLFRTTKRAT